MLDNLDRVVVCSGCCGSRITLFNENGAECRRAGAAKRLSLDVFSWFRQLLRVSNCGEPPVLRSLFAGWSLVIEFERLRWALG